jgi:DNA-binding MarR family transcriptional regulator
MEKLESVVFYTIEKAIKTYRQFAQRTIKQAGFDITIDQWLVLRLLAEDGDRYQNEIAEAVFKDTASITRIVGLLVKKGYLRREGLAADRRRYKLAVTPAGQQLLEQVAPIVAGYRQTALDGLEAADIRVTQRVLHTIIANCLVP